MISEEKAKSGVAQNASTALGSEIGMSFKGPFAPTKKLFPSRARFHILVMVLLSTLVAIIPANSIAPDRFGSSEYFSPTFVGSLIIGNLIAIISYVILKYMRSHNGANAIAMILPINLGILAMSTVVVTILRLDYSRYVILSSFIVLLVWQGFVFEWLDSSGRRKYILVPEGQVQDTENLTTVDWLKVSPTVQQIPDINGIVADLSANLSAEWQKFISKSVLAGVPIFDIRSIKERLTGKTEVRHLSENHFGSVVPSQPYLKAKKLADLLAAIVLLPIFLIVISIAALWIKYDSAGSVFFLQPRVGLGGRVFQIWKLRSMREHVAGSAFTKAQDNRITKVGAVLRKYRIDEFPQIFNVIKGDMSWIGPRPESLELASWYESEIPFYVYRHAVRPGLTGWAQVNQGNVAEIAAATEKLKFDFYYTKHVSLWLDVLILLKTPKIMFSGFGSK